MTKRMKAETKEVAEKKQRELTVQEAEALRSYIARVDEKTAPTITISEDGKKLSIDHPIQKIGLFLLTEALGTDSAEFATDIITQLMGASWDGTRFNSVKFKAMLAMVINNKPRNEIDAALATHAVLTHQAALKIARQLDIAENMMQQECAQRMYAKLSTNLVNLKDALNRSRAVAETTFTVQQSVGDGARAAIAVSVSNNGVTADAPNEPPAASPLALSDARTTPMPIVDATKEPAVIPEQVQRYRPKLIK